MTLTSSFQHSLNKAGIISGLIACALLAPFVFGFLAGSTTDYFPEEGGWYANYLYFIGAHPFVIVALCLFIIWMVVALFKEDL